MQSQLETLYEEVLNHPKTSDEQRRATEANLLQRRKSRLWSMPPEIADKSRLRNEVIEMVNGIVLLRIPNELAWTLYFETQDHDALGEPRCLLDKDILLSISNRGIQYTGHSRTDRGSASRVVVSAVEGMAKF